MTPRELAQTMIASVDLTVDDRTTSNLPWVMAARSGWTVKIGPVDGPVILGPTIVVPADSDEWERGRMVLEALSRRAIEIAELDLSPDDVADAIGWNPFRPFTPPELDY